MRNLIFLLSLLFISNLAFSFDEHDDDLEFWVSYEQQLGTLNDKFITYGGASVGLSIIGISAGAGIFGNYTYEGYIPQDHSQSTKVIYGGVILGYKSPELAFIRFRLNTLLGYGTIDADTYNTGHFVVSPTLYLDFIVYEEINISLGVTYRYFHDIEQIKGFNSANNSFAATLAFSWIGDD